MSATALPDYDTIVDHYERFAEPETARFGQAMVDFVGVAPHERVLDVAAGTGALTLPLLAAGAEVTAVDLSPPMVARLAQRLGGRARVEAMDGQALALPDDDFDLALSLFGVMLFPDFARGLAELVRVTRPGGRCALGSWTEPTAPMRLLQGVIDVVAPDRPALPNPSGMAALSTDAELRDVFERAGLERVTTTTLTLPWTSPPLAEMAAKPDVFFGPMGPWSGLSVDERPRALAAMQAIAQRDRDKPFTSTAIFGVGVKSLRAA